VLNGKKFLSEFTQRMKDIFMQECQSKISDLSENRLYKLLLPNSNYLSVIKEKYIRIALAKFRLGSHSFMIERGRWQRPKLNYSSRICVSCNSVEDEFHIVLECSRFVLLRNKYIPKFLSNHPSMAKFVHFLNSLEGKDLKRFGIFCYKLFIEYNSLIK